MSASNKTDPAWEHHKATIESLYVRDNLKLEGRGGLIHTMKREHGFERSKAQYERYFKTWNMRKYRKKDEWKSIGLILARRTRVGKDSEVLINGEIISKAKVQKQIRRHTFTTVFEQNVLAPNPRIPEGFEVHTPVAEDQVDFSRMQETAPCTLGTGIDEYPVSPIRSVSPSMHPRMMADEFSLFQMQTITSPIRYFTPADDIPFLPDQDVMAIFQPFKYTDELPFFQLQAGLYEHNSFPPILTNTQRHEFEISFAIPVPLDDHHEYFQQAVGVPQAGLKDFVSLTKLLKALLPSTADLSQTKEQLIPSPNNHSSDSTSRILTLLLFALANNFAGLNSLQTAEVAEFLKRQTNPRLLERVLSSSGPATEAFVEKLFLAAIESEDARTIKILLKGGLNPNDLICTHGPRKLTPIERSSMLHNIEITRLLLQAEVDVNKTYGGYYFVPRSGAVAWALTTTAQSYPTPELVRLLLDEGCNISVHELEDQLDRHIRHIRLDQDIVVLLVDHCAKAEPLDLVRSLVPIFVVEELDNEEATRMIMGIYAMGADLIDGAAPTLFENSDLILDAAAERGNIDLVRFLLHFGVRLTNTTLSNAIRSRNKDIIRFLLDFGTDIHSHEVREFTPLAEAIHWGDAEILDLLEHNGAWSWMDVGEKEKHTFKTALRAASRVGQLRLVQKALDLSPPNTQRQDLSDALLAAICENQEDVALKLIDAGADLNFQSYIFGPDVGGCLFEALRQKNVNIVRSILENDVWIGPGELSAAIGWGNYSIIEKLISMDADPNDYSEHDQCAALVISVEKKDIKSMQLLLNAGADVNYKPMSKYPSDYYGPSFRSKFKSESRTRYRGKHQTKTALTAAVTNGDLGLVEYFLSIGADPDDTQALYQAVSQDMPIIEKILTAFKSRYPHGKHGYGYDALALAIRRGDHTVVGMLLQVGVRVNVLEIVLEEIVSENGQIDTFGLVTPLGVAILERHATSLEMLRILLRDNGDPNSIVQTFPNNHKETALLAAISTEDIQMVQLLIDFGADLNRTATGLVKRTPLQQAAEIGSYEIVQILLEQGALVNAPPAKYGGATALQLAAIGCYLGIAELLLDNGADVNAPAVKFDGRTALEGAAEHGRIDMLRMLVNAGAVFHGTEYERARQLAKDNGHMAVCRYLGTLLILHS